MSRICQCQTYSGKTPIDLALQKHVGASKAPGVRPLNYQGLIPVLGELSSLKN
jgi:hypothetical protein